MSDSTTNLDLITAGQANKEVTANALFDAASPATALGRRASTSAGLTFGYYGGVVTLDDGSLLQIANGTKTLTDAATNYIELDTSDGTVDLNTSAWTGATKKRLYKIIVASGVITSYEDWRTSGATATPGGGVSDGDKGNITVSGSGTVWTIDNNVVTYAKIQDVSATDKLLGRSTSGAGDVEEIVCTAAGRAILDDADATAQRTTLGLGTVATLASDTDTSLSANSDARVATQKAVKAYVDGLITGGATDVMIFKGVINCSTNPNYPAADAGNLYKVSVAGKIGGGSGPNVEAGDTLYCITDGTSAGTHAGVGANWVIVQVNVDGTVALAVVNVFTKNQSVATVALTDGANIAVDASLSNNFKVTLGGNRTLDNPTNLTEGMVLNFAIDQDGTGSRVLSFGNMYKWPGGTVPTWAVTASAKNFFSAYYDGTILRCSGGAGYA